MKKNAFLIAGKHTVEEALKNPRRKVIKVFITEDAKKIINRDNQPKNLFSLVNGFIKVIWIILISIMILIGLVN